jgi:hypothetical protein
VPEKKRSYKKRKAEGNIVKQAIFNKVIATLK